MSGITVISITLFWILMWVSLSTITIKEKYTSSIILSFVLLLILSLSTVIVAKEAVTYSFFSFLLMGIPFLFAPFYLLDLKVICRIIYIIGIVLAPFFLTYDYNFSIVEGGDYNEAELMTMSYKMPPFIFASYYNFFEEKKTKYKILSIAVLLIYLFLLLVIGSRGAIVSVIIFLCFNFISKASSEKLRIKRFSLISVIGGTLYFSFEWLIKFLYDILGKNGLYLLFIDRMYFAIVNEKSLTSGRGNIYDETWEDISSSPIWGNGVSSFDNYSGGYPHNLFLQVLQEGGLLFFIPFVFIFALGVMFLIRSSFKSYLYRFYCFIFCSGVIQLFFSASFWGAYLFWIYISFCINKLISFEKGKKIRILKKI